jgi:hypothetical protein
MPVYKVTAVVEIVGRDANEASLKVETAIDRLYPQGVVGEPEVSVEPA